MKRRIHVTFAVLEDNVRMQCALCGERRGRRACPALNQWICPVCCGTKRLVQIKCPSDCGYLTSSREHPPAREKQRQQRDIEQFIQQVRDLNERQSQVFVLVATFLTEYRPPEFQTLLDEDVAEAAAAVASTLETAARGVIYEHRPAALTAERLATSLTALLADAGKGAGTSFDRDAAVVLRRIADAARDTRLAESSDTRAFLDMLGRIVRKPDQSKDVASAAEETRIILP